MLKLNSEKDLLIIIDMVNGFVNEGAFSSPVLKAMVPEMEKFVKSVIKEGVEVIHYTDAHPEDALEFLSYPVHCLIGTKEADPIDELKLAEIKQIEKNSTNSFFAKNPFDYFKNIYIVGGVSEICIFEFALTSQKYKEHNHISYTVNVIEDLVKTFDAPNHNATKVHNKAMSILKERGVNIVKHI